MKGFDYRNRYEKFLEKLRQARIEAGLTQKEAAKALGKPQSFISKCESGERRVDFVELELLAKLYGKDLEFFRTEGEDG
jgi:transcriptional regulator with XRE-family HTH domain